MTTLNGMESSWRASYIQDAIKLGSKSLPPIDPFEDNYPLINDKKVANEANQLQAICVLTAEEFLLGYSRHEQTENDDDNSDWEWEQKGGAFNAFEDFLNK